MLSQIRMKLEASLLEAAWLTCAHSRPGGWHADFAGLCPVGSRFQNAEGRS
jgi:hypothetical protein